MRTIPLQPVGLHGWVGKSLHIKEEEEYVLSEARMCAWLVAHGTVSSSHSPVREALLPVHFPDEETEWWCLRAGSQQV